MSADHKAEVQSCRSCGAPLGELFVDLGTSPVSNAFVRRESSNRAEPFYPLRAFVCRGCFLVQIEDVVAPEGHFHGDYAYFSSVTAGWVEHARRFVDSAVSRHGLASESFVVEVASNDGYLLKHFVDRGVPCLGIDPAANCAEAAARSGVATEVAFFGRATAERIAARGRRADLMVANNVLAHVPDLNDFVAGFARLLAPSGAASFEFPHLLRLIEGNQFDTIYHEHYSYLSLIALEPLFRRHSLALNDVEELPTHGGSLRLLVRHAAYPESASDRLAALLDRERAAGLDRLDTYAGFREQVRETKRKLLSLLIELKRAGKRIAGYGAPAKGNTLLNYCGIGTDFLDYTVDRSPAKQGLLLPGTRIPVLAPEHLVADRPDYVLILPWNIREEVMGQMSQVTAWGGRFIVPIPEPMVV
jgi:SAM-dependent methyltransferase